MLFIPGNKMLTFEEKVMVTSITKYDVILHIHSSHSCNIWLNALKKNRHEIYRKDPTCSL